jgi:hypothetical protein
MKTCRKCGVHKDTRHFGMNGKYRRGICKSCIKKSDSERDKKNRVRNRERQRKIEFRIKLFINRLKVDPDNPPYSYPCQKCKQIFTPDVMQFDHRDPSTKLYPVSSVHTTHSLEKAIQEINKCDLLCVYCHRRKTRDGSLKLGRSMQINARNEYHGPHAKVCCRCRVSQNSDQFIICKGAVINVCRQCERERNREKRKRASEYVTRIKSVTPCSDCGQIADLNSMEFDHLPRFDKIIGISKACGSGWSIRKLSEEVEKTEVVCAPCHFKRTSLRNQMVNY